MKCLGREHQELQRLGVTVLAISADPPESHARFAKALGLRFRLLSDPDLTVAARYGVRLHTPDGAVAGRSVFLVDRQGVVRFVDRDFRIPRTLAGTDLRKAIDELGETRPDPIATLVGLPSPEKEAKTVLARLVLAVTAEDVRTIDGLLHADFGARPGALPADTRAARQRFLDAWRATFAEERLELTRFSDVLDLKEARVFTREQATEHALESFGPAVRKLAAGLRDGDLLVAARCAGLTAEDGHVVLAEELALDLRKEGDAWRIAALCGR